MPHQRTITIHEGTSRSEKLRIALSLLTEVGRTLNGEHADCGSCGCRVYDDFAEANAAKQIDGAVSRIHRVIDVIEGGTR